MTELIRGIRRASRLGYYMLVLGEVLKMITTHCISVNIIIVLFWKVHSNATSLPTTRS